MQMRANFAATLKLDIQKINHSLAGKGSAETRTSGQVRSTFISRHKLCGNMSSETAADGLEVPEQIKLADP